jgi:hypothetical protein
MAGSIGRCGGHRHGELVPCRARTTAVLRRERHDPLLGEDGEVYFGFLEVLVLIAGVGLSGITIVVGLGAVVGALIRRRNDARVVR